MLWTKGICLVIVTLWSSSIANGKPLGADNIDIRTTREISRSLSPSDVAEYEDLENLRHHIIDIRSPQDGGEGNTIDQGGTFNGGFGNNFQAGLGQLSGTSGSQNGLDAFRNIFGSGGSGSGIGGIGNSLLGGQGFGNGFGQAFSEGSRLNFEQVGGELIRELGNILSEAFTSMASNRRNSFFGNLF